MTEHLIPDAPPVTRDMALELMVHHLQLAHMYFQNIPEDREGNREEVERLLLAGKVRVKLWKDDGGLGSPEEVIAYPDSPEVAAGLLWLDRMEDIYEEMKKEDP